MTIAPIETRYEGFRFRAKEPPSAPQKAISRRADRLGHRFGRLLVLRDLGVAGAGNRWWGCACDCGEKVAVRSRELIRGHTQSCGCLATEIRKSRAGANKLPPGEASLRVFFGQYSRSAKYRGLEFAISEDEFRAMVSAPCAYCGSPPLNDFSGGPKVNGSVLVNGIDRVDNRLGYLKHNCVPCCSDCNMAKGRMSEDRWRAWLDRIVAFRRGEEPVNEDWIDSDAEAAA